MHERVNLKDIPKILQVLWKLSQHRGNGGKMSEISRRNPFLAPFPLSHLGLTSKTPRIRSDSSYSLQGFHLTLDLWDLNFKGIIFGWILFLFCSFTMLHISSHEGSKITLRFRPNKSILLMICYPPFILFSILQADFQTQSSRICLRK